VSGTVAHVDTEMGLKIVAGDDGKYYSINADGVISWLDPNDPTA